MSRYCTGNVVIGPDMCSLVENQDYINDETIKRTKFTENVKEGDALLLNLRYENGRWILFYVTKVESDSLLYFTPRFSTGPEEIGSYDYSFPGQVDDEYQISADGRYCFNSYWYTSRDYTCFFHLPEVRRGDRAWASIFDAAMVRADKLLKSCYRETPNASCSGGMILRVLGTTIPEPIDPGGEVAFLSGELYNTGYTESSVTSFVNAYPSFITSNIISADDGESFYSRNRFNNVFMALCAIILYMEKDTSGDKIILDSISIVEEPGYQSEIFMMNSLLKEYYLESYFTSYTDLIQSGYNFQTDGTPILSSSASIGEEAVAILIPQRIYTIKEAIGYAINTPGYSSGDSYISMNIEDNGWEITPELKSEQQVLTASSETNPYRYATLIFSANSILWLVRVTCFEPVDTSSYNNEIPLMLNGMEYNTGYTEESINIFTERFLNLIKIDYNNNEERMSLHYFSNFFVGVACIISLIEMNCFDSFYVNIDETYDGVFVYAIQASKIYQNFYYGAKYGDTLNPVNLVPPGAYFSSASDGTVTKIFGGTSHPAKIPQDYFQLSMAIGYAQNTPGFEPRSMVLDDNDSSSLEYSFDTSVEPFLILAYTNEFYPKRFKTLRFKTSDGTIWLVRVQCFDPINTEGP